MTLVERNYMIEEISTAASHPALCHSILPGTSVSDSRTTSCLKWKGTAILRHDSTTRAKQESKDEVAEATGGAGQEWTERSGVLPGAGTVCSAVFCLEEEA